MRIMGKAVLQGDSLRCQAPRTPTEPKRVCNKLLAKLNLNKEIKGQFKCERCHSLVEVL